MTALVTSMGVGGGHIPAVIPWRNSSYGLNHPFSLSLLLFLCLGQVLQPFIDLLSRHDSLGNYTIRQEGGGAGLSWSSYMESNSLCMVRREQPQYRVYGTFCLWIRPQPCFWRPRIEIPQSASTKWMQYSTYWSRLIQRISFHYSTGDRAGITLTAMYGMGIGNDCTRSGHTVRCVSSCRCRLCGKWVRTTFPRIPGSPLLPLPSWSVRRVCPWTVQLVITNITLHGK